MPSRRCSAGWSTAALIFNIAFIVVLVSLVVQGWTVGPLARRLGLIVPASASARCEKVELELPGSAHHELLAYTRRAPAARWRAASAFRAGRGRRWWCATGRSMRFQDMGRLVAGDHVYIFVPDRYPRLLDRLFASRTEVDPEDADFFGAFAVDPAARPPISKPPMAPGLTEAEQKMTIGGPDDQRGSAAAPNMPTGSRSARSS